MLGYKTHGIDVVGRIGFVFVSSRPFSYVQEAHVSPIFLSYD